MSLKIRLSRAGAKKRPFYRIVIADSRFPRDGRFIEIVGTYEPILPKDHEKRTVLQDRAHPALAEDGRPADRPRAALPRCRRPCQAHAAQQSAEGAARQEGAGARRCRRRGAPRPGPRRLPRAERLAPAAHDGRGGGR